MKLEKEVRILENIHSYLFTVVVIGYCGLLALWIGTTIKV
jgi:hypothetical protein